MHQSIKSTVSTGCAKSHTPKAIQKSAINFFWIKEEKRREFFLIDFI